VWPDVLEFQWDAGNEDEMAAHHVTPREVEEVYDETPVFRRNKKRHAAPVIMIGLTSAGRLLTVPMAPIPDMDGTWRAATAWDADADERAAYESARSRRRDDADLCEKLEAADDRARRY
jgi:hypothetical protein